jgi:hypothetical protein
MMTTFRVILFVAGGALLAVAFRDLQTDGWSRWATIAFIGCLGALLVTVAILWQRFAAMVLRQIAPDKVFNGPPDG